jgi:shikimate kinase
LVHEELGNLVEKHKLTLSQEGFTISLLPNPSLELSTKLVVERQMNRGWRLYRENQIKKFKERYPRYLDVGDTQIFSIESPENVAQLMYERIIQNNIE